MLKVITSTFFTNKKLQQGSKTTKKRRKKTNTSNIYLDIEGINTPLHLQLCCPCVDIYILYNRERELLVILR
jgi:hypothetical protein